MKVHQGRRDAPDRMKSAFAGADANAPAPRSASIHLLNPAATSRNSRSLALSTQTQAWLPHEAAEVLTDVDGLPILVRFLVKDMPAQTRPALKACDVDSLLSSTLEKMICRIGGLPPRNDAPLRQPLAIVELISGGDTLARQEPAVSDTVLRVGSLALDLMDRTAKRGDRQIGLRPREFQLLKYMMQRCDKLLTRANLFKEVWNYKFVPDSNLVDVHMGRLRRKVDGPDEAPMIRNVRGAGFVLSAAHCSEGRPGSLVKSAVNRAAADRSSGSMQGGQQ